MILVFTKALFIIIGVTSLIYIYQCYIQWKIRKFRKKFSKSGGMIRPQGIRLSDNEREKVRKKFSNDKDFYHIKDDSPISPDPSIDFTQYLIRKKRQSELREQMEYSTKEYHDTLLNYDKGFLK